MKDKFTIIGSGSMATAIAKVLYDSNNKNILIYGINELELNELKEGKNTKYFPKNSKIPKFNTTNSLVESLKETHYVILAIPSQFIDKVFENILAKINSKVIIINLIKGFYPKTNSSIYEGLKKKSKNNLFIEDIVSLIGPSHSEEIVREFPTFVSIVGDNEKILKKVQQKFSCSYFKTILERDIKGSEAGAIYKNVLAIGSGMLNGLGYKANTSAAFLTMGFLEMIKFNKFFGGKTKTIFGLTGFGDLIVTATSDLSRNYNFGKNFIKNNELVSNSKKTIEGLIALKYLYNLSKSNNLNLLIVELIYEIIFKQKNPQNLIQKFWKNNFYQK